MSSEQNNSTSFPQSEPKLCSNGCGFFGSPSNMNLCSKCYRNLRIEEDQNAVAQAAVKKSLTQPLETKPESVETVVVTAETSSSVPVATEENKAEPSSRRNEEQEQHDSTSIPPLVLKPCNNGCGFFGSPSTMNLCSKCYSEEEQTVVKKPLKLPSCSLETKPVSLETVVITAEPSSDEAEPSKPTRPNRCFSCNKKVGVMGFKCKCGSMFCGSHRYPEKHDCSFDFKEGGREAIAKANPVIKADKVQRF